MKYKDINEQSYAGNLGFEEMMNFFKIATDKQANQMEKIVAKEDWKGFKNLIKKTLGVKLK